MSFNHVGQLARSVLTARATDPLGLVAENLRDSPHGVLPVLDRPTYGPQDPAERNARVIGLISQADLARASARLIEPVAVLNGHAHQFGESNEVALAPAFDQLKARDVMQGDVPYIPAAFSLHNALLTLDRYNLTALPVLDGNNRYLGLISRADILSALNKTVRPPLVGGMATPLGVWLTDGRLSGGAPALGLFLTGVMTALCLACSQIGTAFFLMLLNREWGAMAFSGRLSGILDQSYAFATFSTALQGVLFLILFRLLPITGIHAAEHQTVHALERGLPLEPEYVEKMPRAHPRCGTNLMVLASLVTIGIQNLPSLSSDAILLPLVFTFFFWRSFGDFVQNFFTTKPASRKQIEGGIKAANELIAKYQSQTSLPRPMALRLLNAGMIWSALGMAGTLILVEGGLSWLAQAIVNAGRAVI